MNIRNTSIEHALARLTARRTMTKAIRGFTLIELLIVVVILSTLAAVVVPQFSSSSDGAKAAATKTNLNSIRSALEMYRVDKMKYPLTQGLSTAITACATFRPAPANSTAEDKLFNSLSYYTDVNGNFCNQKTGAYVQGPYLKTRNFPENPIKNSNQVLLSATGALGLQASTSDTAQGWRYDPVTGEFVINDPNFNGQ